MDQQNFGKETFTKVFDPELLNGWGKRTYNWEMGVSVQQELVPRVGLTVGYVRRWYGNFYTADNTQTTAADYTPYSIPIPVDPRLPGGGGGTVSGLYNLVPGKVGQEVMYQQLSSNFADMTERWQGVDVSVNARLRNGLTVQGGTSTGARYQDNCEIRSVLPETYSWDNTVAVQTTRVATTAGSTSTSGLQNYSCRVDEPLQTSFRGLATYTVPKIDVQVSGTWRSDPGNELRADYVVTSAVAQPSLGRPLSSGNVTVNLIPRGTLYGARINNIDLRVAKILRFGQTRTQFGLDLYNLLNNDADDVQQRVFADRRVAHADGDPAGALYPFESAARFLIHEGHEENDTPRSSRSTPGLAFGPGGAGSKDQRSTRRAGPASWTRLSNKRIARCRV
jgi:hypothetical protein